MSRQLLTLFVAAVCASNLALARPVPPPGPPTLKTMPPATLKRLPVSALTLGSLKVELEQTTLAEVKALAGNGRIDAYGEQGSRLYWLCYTVESQDTLQQVWLISDAEMGGPEHRITEVQAQSASDVGRAPTACPLLAANLQPLALDGRLWLGSSQRMLRTALGRPSVAQAGRLGYAYAGKVKLARPDGKRLEYDRVSYLTASFDDGVVTRIGVAQITSY